MPAVWTQLVLTTQTILQGLNLTHSGGKALPDEQVYVRKRASDRNTNNPFLMVAPGDSEDLSPGGSFEDHEFILPVLVVHAFPRSPEFALNDDELVWRQQIIETFLDLPRPEVVLDGVNVMDCQVDTSPRVDRRQFNNILDVGGMLLKFRVIKTRGRE